MKKDKKILQQMKSLKDTYRIMTHPHPIIALEFMQDLVLYGVEMFNMCKHYRKRIGILKRKYRDLQKAHNLLLLEIIEKGE